MTEIRTFTFPGARGDRLTARLDMPDHKPRAVVLVAHCFSGGNAGPAAAQIAHRFSELGTAVLSVDFEGELSGEQRGRLLAIAERCPVHHTLHSEVLISTAEYVPDGLGTC